MYVPNYRVLRNRSVTCATVDLDRCEALWTLVPSIRITHVACYFVTTSENAHVCTTNEVM